MDITIICRFFQKFVVGEIQQSRKIVFLIAADMNRQFLPIDFTQVGIFNTFRLQTFKCQKFFNTQTNCKTKSKDVEFFSIYNVTEHSQTFVLISERQVGIKRENLFLSFEKFALEKNNLKLVNANLDLKKSLHCVVTITTHEKGYLRLCSYHS